jgi:hypothetical protein
LKESGVDKAREKAFDPDTHHPTQPPNYIDMEQVRLSSNSNKWRVITRLSLNPGPFLRDAQPNSLDLNHLIT